MMNFKSIYYAWAVLDCDGVKLVGISTSCCAYLFAEIIKTEINLAMFSRSFMSPF